MEVNFSNDGGAVPAPVINVPATATPVTETPAASAPPAAPTPTAEATAVVLRAPSQVPAPSGLVMGDKLPEFKDIILPRINLVQNIGELKSYYDPGTIVFGQNTVLWTPQKNDPKTGNCVAPASRPVMICVLGFRPTRFVEKVDGGGKGLILNTENEVPANGGTLDYKEWQLKKAAGMKLFQPLAEAVVAVRRPEGCADDGTVFVYEVDGHKYALGLWAMKGTAYTAAAKRVFFTNRSVGCLRGGYSTRFFAMTCREESFGTSNKAWVPICIPQQPSSPEFLAFVGSILNPPQSPA